MKFLRFIIIFTSIFLLLLPKWLGKTFGKDLTTEQLIFHLFSGRDGVAGTDITLIKSFIKFNIFLPLAGTILICILIFLSKQSKPLSYLKSLFLDLSIKFQATFPKILQSNKTYFIFLVISLVYFLIKIQLPQYILIFTGPNVFTQLYKNPKDIELTHSKFNKNLILIYIESLEFNLRNVDLHSKNLIREIDQIEGDTFKLHPAPGTGWSIAGMISSQCSIPLKPYYGNDLNSKRVILPSAQCLGDILADRGYKQYFLVGPDLKFSGMDKFYNSHGYQYAFGLNEFKNLGMDPKLFTGWGGGLNDDTLFIEARRIIEENVATGSPYNLTLITTDTHAPNGLPSPRCSSEERTTGYRGAFECTSRNLASFIKSLKSNGLLKNTVLVIMGDHPFMAPPELSNKFPNPREVYFKFYDSSGLHHKARSNRNFMTHFDVAPTILDSLGILNSSEKKFGLGVSLFSSIDSIAYEKHFMDVTSSLIINHSPTYDGFWFNK